MFGQIAAAVEAAPLEWSQPAPATDCRLHQLAPYIGKLKPVIARQLVQQFTAPGDVVLDCFSGSGTIPLEAVLLGRHALAFDVNPYAYTLTRAKLQAPKSYECASRQLAETLAAAETRSRYVAAEVPEWVQKFFHPDTLQSALLFADECLDRNDHFLLACLLSILHHQRPGFLSYPSSHLVPYLRDRKYPRDAYPDMYLERALRPRLEAKLRRIYKNFQAPEQGKVLGFEQVGVADLNVGMQVDAIITSPPYMNALDYVRDNRLRMWFLDRSTADYSPEPTDKSDQSDAITDAFARNVLSCLRVGGHCVLVVGETVRRKRITTHPAERIFAKLSVECPTLRLEQIIQDVIPDVRRSRREGAATKRELILVLKKG